MLESCPRLIPTLSASPQVLTPHGSRNIRLIARVSMWIDSLRFPAPVPGIVLMVWLWRHLRVRSFLEGVAVPLRTAALLVISVFFDAMTDPLKRSRVSESIFGMAFRFVYFVWVEERASIHGVIEGRVAGCSV